MTDLEQIIMLRWAFNRVCDRYSVALDVLSSRGCTFVDSYRGELADIKSEVKTGRNNNDGEPHEALSGVRSIYRLHVPEEEAK